MMSEKSENTTRTWTVDQQLLEDYINDDEDSGNFLAAMGIITKEELAAGIHQDEDFRVKVELDPEFASKKARELEETGVIKDLAKA